MGVILAKSGAEIQAASATVAKDTYESISRKEKAGAATQLDVLQAQVDFQNKQADADSAKQNYEVALLQLKDLAGIDFDAEVSFPDAGYTGTDITQAVSVPASTDMNEVLARSTDYQTQRLQLELANIGKTAALQAFLPTVSASLNFGYAKLTGLGNDDSINKDNDWFDSKSFSAGVNITIPIVEGGYRAAKIKEAEATQKQAKSNLEKKERAIRLRLAQLRQKLESDVAQVKNLMLTQETAARGLESAQSSFRNGVITRLDLADARNQAEETRLGYENAVYNLFCDWFDWLQATGTMKEK
jgi:multidrug efflux system outer membrane protein